MSFGFNKNLPIPFVQNVTDLCGDDGKEWLESLPKVIEELEDNWEIRVKTHFSNLSYNYAASCSDIDGNPRVLKIALPLRNPEIFLEAKTLKAFADHGVANVLKQDKDRRAILLERLLPGKNLKELFEGNKDQAVEIAIKVLQRLTQATPEKEGFPRIEEWFAAFDEAETTEFSKTHLEKAREKLNELMAARNKPKLIHGDFHHENILSDGPDGFRTIDPKGVIGNLGYEISVFLNNHLEWIENKRDMEKAVGRFSDSFSISPKAIKDWSYVQQVLAACWDFEDNGRFGKKDLENAEIWETLQGMSRKQENVERLG